MTKSYSQSGCEFECTLKNTIKDCHCIPWNFPRYVLIAKIFGFDVKYSASLSIGASLIIYSINVI